MKRFCGCGVAAILLCLGATASAQSAAPANSASEPFAATASDAAADAAEPKPMVVIESVANDQVKKRMAIAYPPDAISAKVSGAVKLQILVGLNGRVVAARAVSGPDELLTAARNAAASAEYTPMTLDGKPFYMATTIRLAFDLDTSTDPPKANVRELVASEGQPEDAAALTADEPFAGAPGMGWSSAKPKVKGVTYFVTKARLIHKVEPDYPRTLKQEHIQGTVVLRAVIQKDGVLRDITYVSGPKPLSGPAIDAVKQWRYAPTLMLGKPVEVETTISVVFSLGAPPPKS
ncbi:MAG: energy transducer TonB [Candidatus Acidiferrales bacterium]